MRMFFNYGLHTDSRKSRKIIAKTTTKPIDKSTLDVIEILSDKSLLEIIVVETEHTNKNRIPAESVSL
ncbi:MAG: hypothetical protein GAK29_02637 [Acinetobacter bereziniae]|uniref:Uncharacterized protein n=1 Tax=Acinetobacter bereziniae TaxID=106648 RepID=A0A833PD95_ACIBZ|nr:MAG: hypothetical protein GAK29_02637 [Acinetobacter bereziniae]